MLSGERAVGGGSRLFLVTRKLASMCWGVRDSRTLCWGKRKRSSVAPAVVKAIMTGREAGGGGTQGFWYVARGGWGVW
jgi:hypothetical protein